MRQVDRSRFYAPLIFSGALLGLYWFFHSQPLLYDRYDIREIVFGKKLRGLLFVAFVPLIFLTVRLLDAIIFDLFMSRRRKVMAPQLLREILAIVLYFLLFTWTISAIFNYSITGWLTTTTVLAAVVGLALQDTLGNLFAGIALHLEDSFDVGDVVHSGDYIGVVEGVTWRATRIRGFNNQKIILPNSVISRERLEIFPDQNLNGRVLSFGVDYHVAPAIVIEVLTHAAAHIDGIARDMPCFARIGGFTDSAVTYDVKYFARDYARRDVIDADIRRAVWYALRRNNISFATPVRAYQAYTPPVPMDHVVPVEEIATRLMAVDVLSPLSEEAHKAIADAARVHFYSKGETILRYGADGDSMFVVHIGTVSVRLPDSVETTGTHEVAQLEGGSVFGEMALLTGERRAADVVAMTDVTTFEIGKDALQPILQSHPELAALISEKVMERRDKLSSLLAGDPQDVAKSLLSRIRAYFSI